jgi:integrase
LTDFPGYQIRYFEHALALAKRAATQADGVRARTTANSIFNQAKAIFKPKALAGMRRRWVDEQGKAQEGLHLPAFNLTAAWKEEKFDRVKAEFTAPTDKVIKTTLEKWLELPRNQFLAVGLELAFGLRAGEIAQATWELFTVVEGAPFLRGNITVKSKTGWLEVRGLDTFYSTLLARIVAEGWRGKSEEFVLQGTMTDRSDAIFRNVSAWMRGLGWKTQKTNHALRAYSGSQVAMRYGIYSASVWLRHSSVKVTEDHYMRYLELHKIGDPTKLTAKWASVVEVVDDKATTVNDHNAGRRLGNKRRPAVAKM